jgi:hypothetical protein
VNARTLTVLLLGAAALALGGCAHDADPTKSVAATSPAASSTSPGTATSDPLATAPVPPAPPSSAFTWPTPAKRNLDPTGKPRGVPNLTKVDRKDPTAVAAAFAVTAYSLDARTDATPTAAGVRAAALATPKLAAVLKQDRSSTGDADWSALVKAEGYRSVTAKPNEDGGAPAGNVTTAYASFVLTITDHPGATRTLTVYLKLARGSASAGWAVDDMRGNS